MTAGAAIGFAPAPDCTTTVDMLVLPLVFFCLFSPFECVAHAAAKYSTHKFYTKWVSLSPFTPNNNFKKTSKITQLKCGLVSFLLEQTCRMPPQLFLAEAGEKSAFITPT